jgi:hypothetical protein
MNYSGFQASCHNANFAKTIFNVHCWGLSPLVPTFKDWTNEEIGIKLLLILKF